MVSPALTSSGTRLPSLLALPRPAASTLPCCGFSLAESGMTIAPTRSVDSSRRSTMRRSWSGLTFMNVTPETLDSLAGAVWKTLRQVYERTWPVDCAQLNSTQLSFQSDDPCTVFRGDPVSQSTDHETATCQ